MREEENLYIYVYKYKYKYIYYDSHLLLIKKKLITKFSMLFFLYFHLIA